MWGTSFKKSPEAQFKAGDEAASKSPNQQNNSVILDPGQSHPPTVLHEPSPEPDAGETLGIVDLLSSLTTTLFLNRAEMIRPVRPDGLGHTSGRVRRVRCLSTFGPLNRARFSVRHTQYDCLHTAYSAVVGFRAETAQQIRPAYGALNETSASHLERTPTITNSRTEFAQEPDDRVSNDSSPSGLPAGDSPT